jgi:hypothetical protein
VLSELIKGYRGLVEKEEIRFAGSQEWHKGVTRVLQECYKSVTSTPAPFDRSASCPIVETIHFAAASKTRAAWST